MSNVVGLRGEEIRAPGTADPGVVEELEQILEMARSGEIHGITIAMEHADNCVSGRRKGITSYKMIGMMHRMMNDICADIAASEQ